jgi:hypothetical protein
MLIERADVDLGDLQKAAKLLSKLGSVNLDDMLTLPAFDEMGNGQCETPEWKQWAAVRDLVDESRRLAYQLDRAYFEARDA